LDVILGIDIGGSTTKIVGFSSKNHMIGTLQVKATDQVTSMYGAIGNFLRTYGIPLKDVYKIVLTGVGASYIAGNVYEVPTVRIDEFRAIGLGGSTLTSLDNVLVVSMGTGTAFVRVTGSEVTHIGGSGVGGGTLLGLSRELLHESEIGNIAQLAETGELGNVDLLVSDISDTQIPNLPPNATASNFGNLKNSATSSDKALALINMVFQTIGTMSFLACYNTPIKDIVLTGALTVLPQADKVFAELGRLYKLNFIIPPLSIFATAIGAAVSYLET
jgi:type II pantothenate kinase